MTSEDDSAHEFELIMADIRSHLTGDPGQDSQLLLRYSEQYRQHPLVRAIAREIGRMLYELVPLDGRKDLDNTIDGLTERFQAGLADGERRLSAGDASGARQALEAVITYFDDRGDYCQDDAVSEYRIFRSPYEAALYQRLFEPRRDVRMPPYDLARLYLIYGTTLVELGDLDAAETELGRARFFSPVDTVILYELSEVLKLQRRWEEFHELSTFALSVSFDAQQAARGYRNLGFYYTETHRFDVAEACYKKSGLIDRDSVDRCVHELMYIGQQTGKEISAPDMHAVDVALGINGIQVSVSRPVQEVTAEIDSQYQRPV